MDCTKVKKKYVSFYFYFLSGNSFGNSFALVIKESRVIMSKICFSL